MANVTAATHGLYTAPKTRASCVLNHNLNMRRVDVEGWDCLFHFMNSCPLRTVQLDCYQFGVRYMLMNGL